MYPYQEFTKIMVTEKIQERIRGETVNPSCRPYSQCNPLKLFLNHIIPDLANLMLAESRNSQLNWIFATCGMSKNNSRRIGRLKGHSQLRDHAD